MPRNLPATIMVGPDLHQPCRCGVTQDVWRDIIAKTSGNGDFLHGAVNTHY
jgi:hypothetical protein